MTGKSSTVFRAEALLRLAEAREQVVLPRFVSPRVFLILWLLLGLVAAAGLIAWLMLFGG